LTLLVGSNVKELVVVGAAGTLIVTGAWAYMVYRTRHEYVEAFRVALPGAASDPHAIRVDLREARQRDALRRALASADPRAVRLGLGVLAAAPSPPAFAEVGRLTGHAEPDVRAKAWDVLTLSGDRRMVTRASRDAGDSSSEVRAAAVRYLAHATDGLVDELAVHPDVRVRLAALAYLAREGREAAARASGHIGEILSSGVPDREVRVEVAAALAALPLDEASRHLPRLLFDRDDRVADAAGRSAAQLNFPLPLAELLEALGDASRRRSARAALRGYGSRGVPDLARALDDPETPRPARQAIPSLLASIGTRAATEALISVLHRADGPLRTRIVRALWRLRRDARSRLGDAAFRRVLEDEARTYAAHLTALERCDGDGRGMSLLRCALSEKLDDDLERILRLLGLRYPERDVLAAYYGLRREEASLRASALELLDNLLERPLERQLLGLIESHANPGRITHTGEADLVEVLHALAADADPWLRTCAVYALGEVEPDGSVDAVVELALGDADERVREAAALVRRRPDHEAAVTSEVPC
jgi:AAA family ATP:ADP antiporter